MSIDVLLNESLTSFYWVGFLLADGSFTNQGRSVKISISINDLDHLKKYSMYIDGKIKQYESSSGFIPTTYVEVSKYDSKIVPEIMRKFMIESHKTINPPIFKSYSFTDKEMIALFVGFIDGDGCLSFKSNDKNVRLTIQNHAAWLDNLDFLNKKLHSYFRVLQSNHASIDKRGFACISIAKRQLLSSLKHFIEIHNLPVLTRKWEKISNETCGSKNYTNRDIILNKNYKSSKPITIDNVTFSSISDAARYFGVTNRTILRLVKRP